MGTQKSALDDAVRLLARRSHGQKELEQKLIKRGHLRTELPATFARLKELGYLEPEPELAERYAREIARKKGATPLSTTRKLRDRGFSKEDTQTAVDAAFRSWDARMAALETVDGVSDPTKAARRLLSRGFPSDAIAWVVSRLREANPLEEDAE